MNDLVRPDGPAAGVTSIRVQTEDFDVGAEIARLRAGNPDIGAIASFIGVCRDRNDGASVGEMTLEHYPGMTEKALQAIASEARTRWSLIDLVIVHRVGTLRPTDQIVLVIVSGGHRGEAFAACEFLMDYLKTKAPFWKKESTPGGERWVDSRASDDMAADRWK
ncbi:MAG: molybdopterin synthase catalytic subunit MoaE [Betaproteobacteria bacterium]